MWHKNTAVQSQAVQRTDLEVSSTGVQHTVQEANQGANGCDGDGAVLGTDLMKSGSNNTIQEAGHGGEDPWSTDLEGNGGDQGFGTRRRR